MICLLALLTAGRGVGLACTRRFSFHEFYNFLPFDFLILFFFWKTFFYPRHLPTPTPTNHTHDPRPLPTTHDPRHLATLHAYHGSDVYSYAYGLLCHWRSKDSDPKHRNIRDMEGTSTYSTMRVECIVFYVDPKSVGSLNFLGKEQNIRLS